MKKILITGGNGFLGQHLKRELAANGYAERVNAYEESVPNNTFYAPSSRELDLLNQEWTEIVKYCHAREIDHIIHLAADCGGIGYNQAHPGDLARNNLLMGINIIDAARALRVEKLLLLGTVCMYPCDAPIPFKESDLWSGRPEITNSYYGNAKKMLMEMAEGFQKQGQLNAVTLIPINMAGEFDHFEEDKSHVIPALIKKFVDAKKMGLEQVTVWGSGNQTREFVYAGDVAKAIRLAIELYDNSLPVNIGSGKEVSIRELAEKIAFRVGYKGQIVWDSSKPDGQPRRCLDVSRAEKLFGFRAETDLDTILERSIAYYTRGYVA